MENLDLNKVLDLNINFKNTLGGYVQLCNALNLDIKDKSEEEILETVKKDLFPKVAQLAHGPIENFIKHQAIMKANQTTEKIREGINNSLSISITAVNPE